MEKRMGRNQQSRSAKMPMIELVVMIGIFAIISIFLLEMFLAANALQCKAKDEGKAIMLAESIAETVKSAESFESAVETAGLIETSCVLKENEDGTYQISQLGEKDASGEKTEMYMLHYNEDWELTEDEDTYSLMVLPFTDEEQGQSVENYEIYIYRLKGYASITQQKQNEELYHLHFVKYRGDK